MKIAVDLSCYVHADFAAARSAEDAVGVTLKRIEALKTSFKPDEVIIALDSCRDGLVRKQLCAEYKANRSDDEKYLVVLSKVSEVLSRDYLVISREGHEADDVLASVAAQSSGKVVLMSRDKDIRQCLEDGRVTILRQFNIDVTTGERKPIWFAARHLKQSVDDGGWGISPDQAVDFLCLTGDAADGIRGAKNIGEKTASRLLQQYGSIEAALLQFDNETESVRDSLVELSGRLDVVRRLVELRADLNLSPNVGHEWKLVTDHSDDGVKLVCACSRCELSGRRRTYGYVKGYTEQAEAALLAEVNRQIASRGYYDPEGLGHDQKDMD